MTVVAYWSRTRETAGNFGDALNPWLIEALTGNRVVHYNDCSLFSKLTCPLLFCAGSILERIKRSWRFRIGPTHVWGTGTRGDRSLRHLAGAVIHAVRGPLTRQKLLADGIACPEVYGDPAVLLPRFLPKPAEAVHELSIVPHYADAEACRIWVQRAGLGERVHLIDITAPLRQVAGEIAGSRRVLSSSLHGLIVADAYRVPNLRIRFGDRIAGGDFKFNDYGLTVGRSCRDVTVLAEKPDLEKLVAECELGDIAEIQKIDRAFPPELQTG